MCFYGLAVLLSMLLYGSYHVVEYASMHYAVILSMLLCPCRVTEYGLAVILSMLLWLCVTEYASMALCY